MQPDGSIAFPVYTDCLHNFMNIFSQVNKTYQTNFYENDFKHDVFSNCCPFMSAIFL